MDRDARDYGTVPLAGRPAQVHSSAVVDAGARLAADVVVGPHCVVSAGAVIGRGTVLANHVTVMGSVHIGERNRIFPNCVIGGDPQDVSYRGSDTRVEIGDDNVIREGVTINRASEKEEGVTAVGSRNFLMACCHVAHDCRIGDNVIIANGTLLGGHVRVHSRASLSGVVAVHHWATIGGWSFVAGLSRVLHDVPPFMLCEGSPARPRCI
ncbi:MAG: acyl-ACP--UDP-N-acetylglucosamine O-acyltransferase, partial [Planctomycetia bacterium]|nr:acyl-ACP--UDP-N-acetylglucosamine O-acyltransferase [Planctomycetia bacterium]